MSSAQKTPDKGLEPLTLGLKVPRSTDWANRARLPSTGTAVASADNQQTECSTNPSLY